MWGVWERAGLSLALVYWPEEWIMELVPVRDGCAWKCGLVGIIIAWELNNSHESVKTHGKSLMQ